MMTKSRHIRPAPRRAAQCAQLVPDPRFGLFCIGCGWLKDHAAAPVGVCSECPAYLPVLKDLGARTAWAIYREKAAKAEECL